MPPHALQAGPRSSPTSFAGITGGESVSASAAATVLAGCDAFGFAWPFPPPPFVSAGAAGPPRPPRPRPPRPPGPPPARRVAAHERVLCRLPGAHLGRHDPELL